MHIKQYFKYQREMRERERTILLLFSCFHPQLPSLSACIHGRDFDPQSTITDFFPFFMFDLILIWQQLAELTGFTPARNLPQGINGKLYRLYTAYPFSFLRVRIICPKKATSIFYKGLLTLAFLLLPLNGLKEGETEEQELHEMKRPERMVTDDLYNMGFAILGGLEETK